MTKLAKILSFPRTTRERHLFWMERQLREERNEDRISLKIIIMAIKHQLVKND